MVKNHSGNPADHNRDECDAQRRAMALDEYEVFDAQLSIDSMCQIMLCGLINNGMPLEQMADLLQMDIVVMTLMYVLVPLG